MNKYIEETYEIEGKTLLEILQEWVDENNTYIYDISSKKDIKCKCI